MIADFGVSVCRGCGEAKNLSEFYRAHAVCIACCRSKSLMYKRKMRVVHMRERRITALQKYLRSCCVDGDCPVCGNEKHEEGCSIGRLLIDLEVHGWLKKEMA
jgi:hypothetical protein